MEAEYNHNRSIALEIELIKKDISQFEKVILKLDQTNEKIQDLINNISKIVSLHEQKFSSSEIRIAGMSKDLNIITQRVDKVERLTWIGVGIITFITILINSFSSLFSNLFPGIPGK